MNLSSVALAAQTEGLSLAEKGITSAKVVQALLLYSLCLFC
jgi:hypothetical protein